MYVSNVESYKKIGTNESFRKDQYKKNTHVLKKYKMGKIFMRKMVANDVCFNCKV